MSDTAAELKVKLSAEDNLSPAMTAAVSAMTDAATKMTEALQKMADDAAKAAAGHDNLNTKAVNTASVMELVKEGLNIAQEAYEAISAQIDKAIEASEEMTQANNRLAGALVSTGQYSKETADEIKEYAEGVQKAEGADVALTESQVAMGIQMGLSKDKAEEMSEAARKLAAYTGQDLNSAFSMLQRSLTGQTRGLALAVPEIKSFTTSALQQGGAIDLVNQQLDAQYQLYQGSYAAAVAKAKTSLQEVYVALGNIITQNPAFKEALEARAVLFGKIADAVKEFGKWLEDNKEQIQVWGAAFAKAALIVGGLVLVIPAVTAALSGLVAVLAFITGPIGLTLVAIGLLTAAFVKWPGLVDVVVGSLKILGTVILMAVTGPIQLLAMGLGAILTAAGVSAGKTITDLGVTVRKAALEYATAAKGQVEYGAAHLDGAEKVKAAAATHKAATDDMLTDASDLNAAHLKIPQSYDGYTIGTLKQRQELTAQSADLTKNLKDFEKYYDAKIALSINKETDQAAQVAIYRAKTLKAMAIMPTQSTQSTDTMAAEKKKQADIKALRDQNFISDEQYKASMLSSDQAFNTAKFQLDTAAQAKLETALGNTPEAFTQKMNVQKVRDNMELAQAVAKATAAGATEAQIASLVAQKKKESQGQMIADKIAFVQKDEDLNQKMGNAWAVTLDQIKIAQAKHGEVMGALEGIAQSKQVEGTKSFFGNLAGLMQAHNRTAFEIGKQAAVAQATISTFQNAVLAYGQGLDIPFVGEVLAPIFAGAAIAAGAVQIANIESQQYQAHAGMDEVPQSADNQSFTLSSGERVVQPEANKDLTSFLKKQSSSKGDTGGGGVQTINIEVNAKMSDADARSMTDMIIKNLRAASERGTPILSDKAIIKST